MTWLNRDDFPHVVLGANAAWGGYGKVRGGGEVSYRFVSSGVYPYVCTYHPGMIGAVVVGNGKPDGGAYAVTTNAGPVTQAESSQDAMEPQVVPVAVTADIVGAGRMGDRPARRGRGRDHGLPQTPGAGNRHALRFVPS